MTEEVQFPLTIAKGEHCSVCPPVAGKLKKCILLVDDDADLRGLMRAFLEAEGYEVFSCEDGPLALKTFCNHPEVDLLLTDLQMPLISGIQLARELTYARPSLPVIIVSGSMLADDSRRTINQSNWNFMGKPFHLPELLGLIRTLCEAFQEDREGGILSLTEAS